MLIYRSWNHRKYTHTDIQTHNYTNIQLYTNGNKHLYTDTSPYVHTYTHLHTYTYKKRCKHANKELNTYRHFTHIQVYNYTTIQIQ